MNSLNTLLQLEKQVLDIEKTVVAQMNSLSKDFDNNYYFEIETRPNGMDSNILWFTFHIPYLNPDSQKIALELSFTLHEQGYLLDNLGCNAKTHLLDKKTAFLISNGADIKEALKNDEFKDIKKMGDMRNEDFASYFHNRSLIVKEETKNTNLIDFLEKMNTAYIVPFIEDKIKDTQKDPENKEILDEYNKLFSRVVWALENKRMLSNDFSKDFLTLYLDAMDRHSSKNSYVKLNEDLASKTTTPQRKI